MPTKIFDLRERGDTIILSSPTHFVFRQVQPQALLLSQLFFKLIFNDYLKQTNVGTIKIFFNRLHYVVECDSKTLVATELSFATTNSKNILHRTFLQNV